MTFVVSPAHEITFVVCTELHAHVCAVSSFTFLDTSNRPKRFQLIKFFLRPALYLVCTQHSVSHAHFLCTFSVRDLQTSRTRMAQGVCSVNVISLHLALSVLMFHPPSLLLPRGHFDTTFPSAPSSSSLTLSQKRG